MDSSQREESAEEDSFTADQIVALVYAFYADIENDELLQPVFQAALGRDWDFHLMRIVSFWCTLILRTRSFRGNLLDTHLRIPNLKAAHFGRWLWLWHERTLQAFPSGQARRLQKTAENIASKIFSERFGYVPVFRYSQKDIIIENVEVLK